MTTSTNDPHETGFALHTTSEAQEHRIAHVVTTPEERSLRAYMRQIEDERNHLMGLYEQAQHDLAVSEQGRLKAEELRDSWERRCGAEASVALDAMDECDRYRAALERIDQWQAPEDPSGSFYSPFESLQVIARAALEAQG